MIVPKRIPTAQRQQWMNQRRSVGKVHRQRNSAEGVATSERKQTVEIPDWLNEILGVRQALECFSPEPREDVIALLTVIRHAHDDGFLPTHSDDLKSALASLQTVRRYVQRVSRSFLLGLLPHLFPSSPIALEVIESELRAFRTNMGRRGLRTRLKVRLVALIDLCRQAAPKRRRTRRLGFSTGRFEQLALLWGAATGKGCSGNPGSMKKFVREHKPAIEACRADMRTRTLRWEFPYHQNLPPSFRALLEVAAKQGWDARLLQASVERFEREDEH
jgi:hypothetical protein